MATGADKREPGLSRERILDAAAGLVAAEGLDALSMRRLAQALDVWPMALYRYFDDKDALLDALVARATEGVPPPAPGGPWTDRMRTLLRATRDALGGDAGGLGAELPRALVTPGAARLTGDGLGILQGAGFGDEEARRAWRALLAYALGSLALGPAGDAEFDYGLARLLDGLESASRTAPAGRAGA
jgi:AcrR family transcriptional regulator